MRHGFSLVELSIVLVILGLLVGGVLTGQSLIRAAELRSVATEYQKYTAAVHTFRDKYFALPGDMSNATAFWGAAHATPATCLTTVGTGTQTCDGNGDGHFYSAALPSQHGEVFAFWKHLANAGLIEGSFSGMSGPDSNNDGLLGTNVPRSKLSQAGWAVTVYAMHNFVGSAFLFAYDYGNGFSFGKDNAQFSAENIAISADEAWNIDTKLDDGKPGTGKIIASTWGMCTNAAGNGGATLSDRINAAYRLSDTGERCALYFTKLF